MKQKHLSSCFAIEMKTFTLELRHIEISALLQREEPCRAKTLSTVKLVLDLWHVSDATRTSKGEVILSFEMWLCHMKTYNTVTVSVLIESCERSQNETRTKLLWKQNRIAKYCISVTAHDEFVGKLNWAINLVPRAHVSFGQRQDPELWNSQFPEFKIFGVLVSQRMHALP